MSSYSTWAKCDNDIQLFSVPFDMCACQCSIWAQQLSSTSMTVIAVSALGPNHFTPLLCNGIKRDFFFLRIWGYGEGTFVFCFSFVCDNLSVLKQSCQNKCHHSNWEVCVSLCEVSFHDSLTEHCHHNSVSLVRFGTTPVSGLTLKEDLNKCKLYFMDLK